MTAVRRLVIPTLLVLPALLVLVTVALTPTGELFPNQGDLNLYLEKASALAAGDVPYRDFAFEYPPAALVPMALPYLVWPFDHVDLDRYKWLFGAWEAGLLLALAFVLDRVTALGGDAESTTIESSERRRRRTGLRLVVLSSGAILAITFRFDLFPALLLAIAVWAAIRGRPGLAGIALAVGVLAKLFPVAILPAIAVPWLFPVDVRGLIRLGRGFGATSLAGLLPFVALAGADSTFQFLRYNAERGLQVESIGGGLAVLGGLVGGQPVEMDFRFSSVNVDGPFATAWLGLLPVLAIVGFAAIAVLGWRRARGELATLGAVRRSTVVELATLCIVMLLATSKVYSIQYAVWLVPLAALLGGRRFWLAAALIALTIPIHPLLYEGLVKQEALPILVLNARNALLLVLLAWMLRDLARRAPREVGGGRKAEARTAARAPERA